MNHYTLRIYSAHPDNEGTLLYVGTCNHAGARAALLANDPTYSTCTIEPALPAYLGTKENARHAYDVQISTPYACVCVYAANRAQAVRIAQREGFKAHSVNVVG